MVVKKSTSDSRRDGSRNTLRDNTDDIAPLLTVLGAVSAIFWAGMMADRIEPLLRSQAVVALSSSHVAAFVLVPAVSAVALAVVLFLRVMVGPFSIHIYSRRPVLELRSGIVAFLAWILCVLVELAIVQFLW